MFLMCAVQPTASEHDGNWNTEGYYSKLYLSYEAATEAINTVAFPNVAMASDQFDFGFDLIGTLHCVADL